MKVINCGSLNIDYVYTVEHMVQKGETISSCSLDTFCGGKGLNQSIALSRSGVQVRHAGMVGKDKGSLLVDMLENAGVNTKWISFVDESTGHAVIQRDREGDNCILLYGGANQKISRAWIDNLSNHFEKGDCLLLQNEISEMKYLMEKAGKKKMMIVFNPSPMDKNLLRYPLDYVNYFILNRIEAEGLCGKSGSEKELLARITEKFPKAGILLTLGEQGAIFCKDGVTVKQKCFPAKIVDTTAAGDTFTGYFLGSLLSHLPIEAALERAARAAAIAVSRKGASVSIPEKKEVDDEQLFHP